MYAIRDLTKKNRKYEVQNNQIKSELFFIKPTWILIMMTINDGNNTAPKPVRYIDGN